MPATREKPGAARRGQGKLVRPGLLVIAAACGWAALNEPAVLDAPTLIIWLLGAVTAGLLAGAAIAIAEPLLKLIVANLVQAARGSLAGTRDKR